MIYRILVLLMLSCLTFNASAAKKEPLKVYTNVGGDFTLTDFNGIPLSLSDFRGKVVLLTFGYTHCPDVCPTIMLNLQRLMKQLGKEAEKVQVLFVTLDPERDDFDRLKAYMEYFNPGFIALTGSVEDVTKVANQYGTRFEKEPFDDNSGDYSIAHTGVVYLIDQQGHIRVFFKITAGPKEMAPYVKRLLAGE